MATPQITYTFLGGTLAKASEVNQNFADIVSFLSSSVIHRDASVAFTAVPSGPSTDPTSNNQFTRKRYVDTRDQAVQDTVPKVLGVGKRTTDAAIALGLPPNQWSNMSGTVVSNVEMKAGRRYKVEAYLMLRGTALASFRMFGGIAKNGTVVQVGWTEWGNSPRPFKVEHIEEPTSDQTVTWQVRVRHDSNTARDIYSDTPFGVGYSYLMVTDLGPK